MQLFSSGQLISATIAERQLTQIGPGTCLLI